MESYISRAYPSTLPHMLTCAHSCVAQLPQQAGASQLPTGLRNVQSSHVLYSHGGASGGGAGGPTPAGSSSGELDWPQQPRPHSYDNTLTPEAMAAMMSAAGGGGGGGSGGGGYDAQALASLSAQARLSSGCILLFVKGQLKLRKRA